MAVLSFRSKIDNSMLDENLKGQPAFVSVKNKGGGQNNRKGGQSNAISLSSMVLISGSSHPELSKEISSLIGVPLANAEVKRFADGEVSVQVHDNLRGQDVFIIQTCAAPVNDSIMELLLTVSCVR